MPVASGDDPFVIRRFSKDEFGDEANVTQDRKESWFRFMDWTWIASMICTVDVAANRSGGVICEYPFMERYWLCPHAEGVRS